MKYRDSFCHEITRGEADSSAAMIVETLEMRLKAMRADRHFLGAVEKSAAAVISAVNSSDDIDAAAIEELIVYGRQIARAGEVFSEIGARILAAIAAKSSPRATG